MKKTNEVSGWKWVVNELFDFVTFVCIFSIIGTSIIGTVAEHVAYEQFMHHGMLVRETPLTWGMVICLMAGYILVDVVYHEIKPILARLRSL